MYRLQFQLSRGWPVGGGEKCAKACLRAEAVVVPHYAMFAFELGEELIHPLEFSQEPYGEQELS